MMTATIFRRSEDPDASNGGGYSQTLCVNEQVHLDFCYSWYDQTGDEKSAHDRWSYGNLRPCDGSCRPQIENLSPEVEALVSKFLGTNGQERGEFVRETPRYPSR